MALKYNCRPVVVQLKVGTIHSLIDSVRLVSDAFCLPPDGIDFSGVDQVFQLSSIQLTYNFNITIVDDGVLELAEEFSVSLTRVTQDGNVDITPDTATVTIADNDGK